MSDVAKRIEGLSPTKRRALRQRLVKQKGAAPKAAIPRQPRGRGPLPLSFGQERLWFIAELEPESGVYNTFYALRFRGELAVPALDASFLDVVGRHESLRTTFAAPDGKPIQVVHAAPPALPLPVVALERLSAADREAAIKRLVAAAADPVFDLERGPLLRPLLMRLAPQEHILLVVIHHIVSDGWSLGVLVREVAAFYEARATGRPAALPELTIQYADFALWQRQWLEGEGLEEQLSYWRQQLAGAPPTLELPCDRPRSQRRSYRGTTLGLRLTPELSAGLRALSAEHGSTLFTTLLTGFAILLGRISGQSDLVVGSPVANRQRTELEGLIGFLLNTLALRLDLGGGTFEDRPFLELLDRVREVTLDAFAHQDLPFAKLVEELQPERDLGQTPFYQVMFVLQSTPPAALRIPGLEIEPLDNEDQPEDLDFSLFLFPEEEGLVGRLRYSVELYDASTIRRLLRHYRTLLEGIAAAPDRRLGDLSLLSAVERQQLLAEWNDAGPPWTAAALIHQLVEAQAAATPEAVAVVGRGFDRPLERLSYRRLNRRANRLAHHLRSLGVGPDVPVGIYMERSVEMVVAILAALKAGGAYLPLDPRYPEARLAFMLEDAQVRVVLTEDRLAASLPEGDAQAVCPDRDRQALAGSSPENPPPAATSRNLAYLIFTSGSTGRAKGVAVTHRSTAAMLEWSRQAFSPAELAGVLASTSICFDISVFELFAPLIRGGTVIVAQNALELPEPAAAAAVTLINTVPSALRELLRMGDLPPSVRTVNLAGEALPGPLVDQAYRQPQVERVFNLYGPSEDTTYSTFALIEREAKIPPPIGRAIARSRAQVLDRHAHPVPVGVIGELYLSGEGLARGYLRRPEKTAEVFVPDPRSETGGARMYRTGDLVRMRPDGVLMFLGRIDHQIKLRGHRIELGEIETLLGRHPEIAESVVAVRDERLVAYVVAADGAEPTVETLRRYVGAELPEYMVPSQVVFLESLPLTPSRKVDRRALPAPEAARPELETAYLPPTTELEMELAAIWQEVLGVERVGLDDNFFDVGGHSLLLAQVRVRVGKLIGGEVPLMELFRRPSIRALATWLGGEEAPRPAARPARAGVRGVPPSGELAIIGMSARYAGAGGVEEFWTNLCGGVESIRRLSDEELEAAGVDPEIYRAPDYVPACGDVRDPDRFDAALFGFNPREAEILDPQHRMLLECAWEALESAGYDPTRYPGRVGVFAGAGMSRYAMNVFSNPELMQSLGMAPLMLAVGQDYLAPRISYKLNLTGPSMVVQTACSTSLVAVHLAQQALAAGTCDMALAGGVTILEHPPRGYRYLEGSIQSSDGHCRAFDAAGEGMVSSSGAGVVVLKRLADAVADGDHIHAVVKATAVNNDGAVKVGFTAPSEEGQAQVIREALQAAGVEAESIGYVEGHGTATPLGDSIEVAALTRVYRESTARRGFCALGSVKTNVGHADAAAGVASLIKATLAVEHGLVPPSLGFERPNPALDPDDSPFHVPTELRPWDGGGGPRRAGVSSFGIGGTNIHAILEQRPPAEPSGPSREWQLLVLSAATATALDAVTARLAAALGTAADDAAAAAHLADAAYTCQIGRRRLPHRRTVVCRGREDAVRALQAPADWEYTAEVVEDRNQRSVVFLCSGLGEQYPGMGRGLYDQEPVFRAEVDRCCALLEPLLGLDLRSLLYPEEEPGSEREEGSGLDLRRLLGRGTERESEAHRRLSETRWLQPAVFVIEVALARLLRSWGIVPRALIGYSLGEYTAAYLAGVLDLEDALTLVAQRAELISTLPAGAMLAVALPEAEVEAYLGSELSLAASNAPEVTVVAGPEEAIARCEEALRDAGCVCQRLQTRHAFHSSMMEPIAAALGERVRRLRLRPPEIPYLSNVTGSWITAGEATDPDYWGRHLCRPVRFAEGLRELLRDPEPVLLEVGPGQALATAARQHPERPEGKVVLASLRDERERHPDQAFLLRTLGQLWGAGLDVDWSGFYAAEGRRRLPLPTYPFERRRYWIEPGRQVAPALVEPSVTFEKSEDLSDWFYLPAWQPSALEGAEAEEDRRWLLLADGCGLGAEIARQLAAAGSFAIMVEPGEEFARLDQARYTVRPAERSDYEALLADLRREGGVPRHWVHLWTVTGSTEPGDALELGFYSLIRQMQALGGEGYGEPLRLAVVSDGVRATGRGEALRPEKAAVLGPSMVIPLEYPNVRASHIDVTLDGSLEELAGQLIAELRAGLADAAVVYRDGGRWIRSYEPQPLAAVEETPDLPRRAVALILGGFGGLGLTFARYLAETFQARLVLTDLAPFPAREEWDAQLAGDGDDEATRAGIHQLRALEELGAEIVVEQADVADEAAMRGVVERARARFGGLNVVIHAAGVAGGGVIQLKRREMAEEVLRSKLEGMRVLAAVLADAPPQLLLLSSSINSMIGVFAQADYCAANNVLDAFAHKWQHQHPERRCLTVNWGQWKEVGMGVEAERDSEVGSAMLERLGIAPAEGLEAIRRILVRHRGPQIIPQVVVSAVDLESQLAAQLRMRRDRHGLEEALPVPAVSRERHARPDVATPYAAPRNDVEARIVEIWQDLLGIEKVGIRDEFIALGGHSLLGIQLYSRLQEAFGVTVPLPVLFETQTIAAMAAIIAGGEELQPLEAPVVPVPRDRPLPLSFGQERLWFLAQLEPESAAYNIPQAFRVRGPVDPAALERSLEEIVRRHEALRTTFQQGDEGPVQVIAPPGPLALTMIDLSAIDAEEEAVRLLWREGGRPFRMAHDWMIRACLMRLGPGDHLLLVTVHHVVFDTWSQIVLHRELAQAYRAWTSGQEPRLPELAVQYADFAFWQRERLRDAALEPQIAYWTEQLGSQPPMPELPTDRPRPPVETFAGDRLEVRVEPALAGRLEALSRERGVTLFMTMLAIFQTLLHRYTGQQDLTTGTPVGGRTRPEVRDLIGMFINNLVLRTDFSGDPPFTELLDRVRQVCLEAFAHQDLPFEKLVEVLRPHRDLSRAPFYQVMFALQTLPAPADVVGPSQVELTPLAINPRSSIYDLTMSLEETLDGWLEFNTDLYDASTAARLVEHLRCLARAAVAAPSRRLSELPLLSAGQRHQLVEWNDTLAELAPAERLDEQVAAWAARRPEAPALVFDGGTWTYRELDRRADRVAHHLRGLGVGPEVPVAIAMGRSPERVATLLGVMRAGGAWLPLDPTYPPARLGFMLADARVPVLVTESGLVEVLPEHTAETVLLDADWPGWSAPVDSVPAPAVGPESLAYLIYTSGSTGEPKGVMVRHGGLSNLAAAHRRPFAMGPGTAMLQFASFSFDASISETITALGCGAALHLAPAEALLPGPELAELLRTRRITHAILPPAVLPALEGEEFPALACLAVAGEACPPALVERWVGKLRMWNAYGPTEDTICASMGRCRPGDEGRPAIGRPLGNQRVHLLDRRGVPVAIGVAGEAYLGGAGVGRGYLGRPALTAERFVPDPWSERPGGRLYRSGDGVRLLADGRLDFLGRLDAQVKVRGFRIELGEVESALARHPQVAECAAAVRDPAAGAADRALVAYLVPRDAAPEPAELRAFLRDHLPEYMLPSVFVELAELPLGATGKVDRRAFPRRGTNGVLPAPAGRRLESAGYVAPRGEIERRVAEVWQEVLEIERVGTRDNFFDLGGHSLQLVRLYSRFQEVFGVTLPLTVLFGNQTIAAMAAVIAAGEELEPVEAPVVPVPRGRPLPLSFGQERLWFLAQLEPQNPAYNIPLGFRFRGPIEAAAIARSLEEIVHRHEVLRTTYEEGPEGAVQIIGPAAPLTLAVVDLTAAGGEEEAMRLLWRESGRPFDLEREWVIRASLLRLAPREHLLLVTMHHIAFDGWSQIVLYRELAETYMALTGGRRPRLPALGVQYADFARWQRERLGAEALERQIAYWTERLGSQPPAPELPTDRLRPAVETFAGDRLPVETEPDLAARVGTLGRERGTTLYMSTLAIFQTLLHRLTGRDDLTLGTPVGGRTRPEVQDLIGIFINNLVLRLDLGGDPPFAELLERVRETALEAFAHQELPFEKLVEVLRPQRDLSRGPIFQIMFALQTFPAPAEVVTPSGVELTQLAIDPGSAIYDLTLNLDENLKGYFEYNTHLYEAATIRRLAEHFRNLMQGAVAEPARRLSELPLLTAGERHQLLEWNVTPEPAPAERLDEQVAAWAARRPEAPALVFHGGTWTYRELDRRADRVARHLHRLGVGPEVPVAIAMGRSPERVATLLGVMRAGGAWLPLDPTYPPARLAFMLADARVPVLVTESGLAEALPEHTAETVLLDAEWPGWSAPAAPVPAPAVGPESLAYLIYTSGSTGEPKGVMVRHGGLSNLAAAHRRPFAMGPGTAMLQFASFSFDASISETITALGCGAALHLAPDEALLPGPELAELLRTRRITHAILPPAVLPALEGEALPDLELLAVAGEACPPALVERWAGKLRMWNAYGPTEDTICASMGRCHPGDEGRPPIGRPLGNQRVHLLDRRGVPVPIGVAGEAYLGGAGVGRGYLGRPALTAERFVPDPWSERPGGRLYRSGDGVRLLPDGRLDFLGRLDAQVKVRGFRIELGEVESALARHPQVAECAAAVRGPIADGGVEDRALVAYLVPRDQAPEPAELRVFLRDHLPEYMLPSVFVELAELPLGPSGKVDRRAFPRRGTNGKLPAPEGRRLEGAGYVAPRDEIERRIAGVWEEVLEIDRVGTRDNFFDLGGHSLQLVRVREKLREAVGRDLPIVELFQHPSVAALAEHLGGGGEPRVSPGLVRAEVRRRSAGESAPEIAVIGMAGRFPDARDLDEFWRNLRDGVESVRTFSDQELLAAGVDSALLEHPDYVKAAVVLDGVEWFDAQLFDFRPREAETLDPQQRIFLECAWEALEHAGYDPESYPGAIGLFAGIGMSHYLVNLYSNPELAGTLGDMQLMLGNDKDFLPTRVSYKLNLRGPSVSVQTACSTSLVATHLASQSLLRGECEIALVGGVTVSPNQGHGYVYQEGGLGSPDGHCRAFDARARGTIAGNGAGIVVLKRLAAALEDGDAVHAVIRGSAINNDGSGKVGYTAPSVEGQAAVIAEALAMAGVEPRTVSYIEAHGTGTPLGDPIEVTALQQVFGTEPGRRCALGSVKTNLGHLDTAAGVAGLIKTVLALEHRQIPPSLHFVEPNPEIDLDQGPFYVNARLAEWPRTDSSPRRAGVSSFGIGGTNAHVVVEEAPEIGPSQPPRRPWQLLVLSAASAPALETAGERLAAHLEAHPGDHLADVAFTLQVGRRRLPHRRVLVCREHAEAAAVLADPASGTELLYDGVEERVERSVVFLFPGQGAQYVDMGRELYETETVFRDALDRCCELLEPHLGRDLRDVLYPPAEEAEEAGEALRQTWLTQPALFAVEYAVAQQWTAWGIRPEAMLGHSIGEYVAAALASVLTLEEAAALVAARGCLMQETEPGSMISIALPAADVRRDLTAELTVAAINSPDSCVVSGPTAAVDALAAAFDKRGVGTRRLVTSHAFHSLLMEPILARFRDRVAEVALKPPQIPYISNLTGTWIRPEEATDPDYWVRHLRGTVRFAEGLDELLSQPARLFLEVGPGRTLRTLLRRRDKAAARRAFCSLRHPREQRSDAAFLLTALGRLWLAGMRVDWSGFWDQEKRRRLVLPTYPFQRQRFWIEATSDAPLRRPQAVRKELDDWFYLPLWKPSLPPPPPPAAAGEPGWLLVADRGGLAEQVARRLAASGRPATLVRAGDGFARLDDRLYEIDPDRPEDYRSLIAALLEADAVPSRIVHFPSFTPAAAEVPEEERFERAQRDGLYSLLWLTQALTAEVFAGTLTLTVVANGLRGVERGDEIAPEKATLLGALKVIPQEYGHITCRSIDVLAPEPGGWQEEELVAQLVAELVAGGPEPAVAYRGPARLVESFAAVSPQPAAAEAPAWRPRGVYLITGGLGSIGLALAESLARTVKARLVLVERSPWPPRETWEEAVNDPQTPPELSAKFARLLALEEAGAEVLVAAAADVGDRAKMEAVVAQACERFGTLHGVFHLAGIVGDVTTLDATDRENCRRHFRPKVDGARVLAEVLAPLELDFCVLFSSLSVILGGLGFTAYAAANAFLDAFAQAHHRRRLPWISVDWDGWAVNEEETEAEAETGAPDAALGRTLEPFRMQADEGLEALRRVLSLRGVPQIVVSTGDLEARIAAWVRTDAETAEASALTAQKRPELSQDYVAPANEAEEGIAEIWQALLGIEQVGIHDNFLELGGDSLIGVQLIARIRERFRVQLSVQEIFERPTVAAMAERIAGRDDEENLSQLDELLREVEEMSQDEVADELRRHQS